MKLSSIFFFLILFNTFVFGQSDVIEKFDSHKFPCDTGTSTLEYNLCAGIRSEYADSLLNDIYKKIIKSVDREIIADKRKLKLKQSRKDSSLESKDDIQFLQEIDYDQRLKISIINSQKEWVKVRDLNSEVVRITCEGGSACVGIDNLAELDDTLERIKKLLSFYDIDDQ